MANLHPAPQRGLASETLAVHRTGCAEGPVLSPRITPFLASKGDGAMVETVVVRRRSRNGELRF